MAEQLTISQALERARDYYHSGDFANAALVCRLVLDVQPNNEDALSLYSAVAIGSQDWHNAENILQYAIKLFPATYVHHLNLGYVLSQRGRQREATQCYETVLELNPLHFNTYLVLSRVYKELGALERNVSTLQKLVKIRPEDTSAMEILADGLLEQVDYLGRQTEAGKEKMMEVADCLRHIIEIGGETASVAMRYGWILVQLGRLEDAVEQLKRAILAGEDSWESHYALAYALAGMGDLEGSYQEQKLAFGRHVKEITIGYLGSPIS